MGYFIFGKRVAISAVPWIFSQLTTACSLRDIPSESKARADFETTLANKKTWRGKGLGKLRIVYFRKSDGLASLKDGVKRYQLMYEAQLEYPDGNHAYCVDGSYSERGMESLNCLFTDSNAQAVGAKQDLRGSVSFVKSERGWQSENIVANCKPSHLSHQWCAK